MPKTSDGNGKPRTKRGAIREYEKIIREARSYLHGTIEDGFDWNKIRVRFARLHERVLELRALYRSLPK